MSHDTHHEENHLTAFQTATNHDGAGVFVFVYFLIALSCILTMVFFG